LLSIPPAARAKKGGKSVTVLQKSLDQRVIWLILQEYYVELTLITKLKRNMKNKLMPVLDKILLRKRALIECVNDQLKNVSQIEHTRHRSAANGIVNMLAAVVAYTFQPKKPALDLSATTDSQAQRLLLAAVTI
jgi:hypothetical protein